MYYLRKIIKGIFSIYIISTISFFLISLIPGNPAIAILGVDATPDRIQAFRQNFGLDKPILERYLEWLKRVLTGDFGNSLKLNIPVKNLILEKLPLTMIITLLTLVLIFLISIPFAFLFK